MTDFYSSTIACRTRFGSLCASFPAAAAATAARTSVQSICMGLPFSRWVVPVVADGASMEVVSVRGVLRGDAASLPQAMICSVIGSCLRLPNKRRRPSDEKLQDLFYKADAAINAEAIKGAA